MRPFSIRTGLHPRSILVATILAAALLAGCAVQPPAFGRSAAPCGLNAVLYCDRAPHADRCECVRHGELRDLLRTFWKQ